MNTYSHMRDDLTVRQRAVDDAATAIEVFTRQANSNASVDFSGNSAFPVISTFVSDDMRNRYLLDGFNFEGFFYQNTEEKSQGERKKYDKFLFFLLPGVAMTRIDEHGNDYISVCLMYSERSTVEDEEYDNGVIDDNVHLINIPKEEFLMHFLIKECATDDVMRELGVLHDDFEEKYKSKDALFSGSIKEPRDIGYCEVDDLVTFMKKESSFSTDKLSAMTEAYGDGIIVALHKRDYYNNHTFFFGVTKKDSEGHLTVDCGDISISVVDDHTEDGSCCTMITLPNGEELHTATFYGFPM